MKYVHF